jgi:hypothetical protein
VRKAHERLAMMGVETSKQHSFGCQPQPLLGALVALPELRSLIVKPTDPLQLAGTAARETCHHTIPQVRLNLVAHMGHLTICAWYGFASYSITQLTENASAGSALTVQLGLMLDHI